MEVQPYKLHSTTQLQENSIRPCCLYVRITEQCGQCCQLELAHRTLFGVGAAVRSFAYREWELTSAWCTASTGALPPPVRSTLGSCSLGVNRCCPS